MGVAAPSGWQTVYNQGTNPLVRHGAHEPQEKVLSCPRARREIGQGAPAHMSPARKSFIANQEKVPSCPTLPPPPHPLLSSSAPLLALLPHSPSHLLSPPLFLSLLLPPLLLHSSSSSNHPLFRSSPLPMVIAMIVTMLETLMTMMMAIALAMAMLMMLIAPGWR